MDGEQKNGILKLVVIVSAIVAVILVAGTFLTGRSAGEDTEKAVRTVSLLYLEELAGRREQVVASTLDKYINDMDIAVGLLDKNDLSTVENLQAYQYRMKQLYELEKFAFVDNEGLIYTSRGTRTDISQYSFDYENITQPEIFVKNIDSNNKKIVIAVPVDRLPFQGKFLVACFMEIDMNTMLKSISMQTNERGTTFCNLYTSDGVSLTNVMLGGLASENNLFDAISHADLAADYSVDEMREDFANKRTGFVSFTYKDVKGTMCYVPVHGTNWILTYLVRESVISNQISTISDGIIFRSLILSILTALVLAGSFFMMIKQIRRASKITLEKRISETENQVKQQELEEQLPCRRNF